jgi:hypothetical protein
MGSIFEGRREASEQNFVSTCRTGRHAHRSGATCLNGSADFHSGSMANWLDRPSEVGQGGTCPERVRLYTYSDGGQVNSLCR